MAVVVLDEGRGLGHFLRKIYLRGQNVYNPHPDRQCLEKLPPELLDHVVSFLPKEAIVALSLVSRYYRENLGGNVDLFFGGSLSTKRKFVLLLERDLPHMIVCYFCIRLFDWRRPGRWTSICFNRHEHPSAQPYAQCWKHPKVVMYRETVDLLIRGHEKGSKYGLPLSYFDHQCHQKAKLLNVRRAFKPRVVDSILLLWSSCEVVVDWNEDLLTQLLENRPFAGVCYIHANQHVVAIALYAMTHVRAGKSGDMATSLIKCVLCKSDLRVRVCRESEMIVKVELKCWRQLGDRESGPGSESVIMNYDEALHPSVLKRNLENFYNTGVIDEHISDYARQEGGSGILQGWRWDVVTGCVRLPMDEVVEFRFRNEKYSEAYAGYFDLFRSRDPSPL